MDSHKLPSLIFTEILYKRNIHEHDKVPFFWKLKLTNDEFESLKHSLSRMCSMQAGSFECNRYAIALYYSEYYRRIYNGGQPSNENVYKSIDPTSSNSTVVDNFYQAACKAAEELNLQRITVNNEQRFYSLLYQGGLPMNMILSNTDEKTSGGYLRFLTGLLRDQYLFDEISLNQTANQSNSLREFCTQLQNAMNRESCADMPFDCSPNHPWFQILRLIVTQEKATYRAQSPFSLKIRFQFNDIAHEFDVSYCFEGAQVIQDSFITANRLSSLFYVRLCVDDTPYATYEYCNRLSTVPVRFEAPYDDGSTISVRLNQEPPILSKQLSFDDPILLYQEDGDYYPGNRIGKNLSRLIMPMEWTIENADVLSLQCDNYSQIIHGKELRRCKVITIPDGFNQSFAISNGEDRFVINADMTILQTSLLSHPLPCNDIVEKLYDANDIRIMYHAEDRPFQTASQVQYRLAGSKQWTDKSPKSPYPIGKLQLRCKLADGSHAAPISLIHIGQMPVIELQHVSKKQCKVSIQWKSGQVRPDYRSTNQSPVTDDNGAWIIQKIHIHNGVVPFVFTPDECPQHCFRLSVRVLLEEFAILDSEGEKILPGTRIPLSDVNHYQYHIQKQNVTLEVQIDNCQPDILAHIRTLQNPSNLRYTRENHDDTPVHSFDIPITGYFTQLAPWPELCRMLDRTCADKRYASVHVKFITQNKIIQETEEGLTISNEFCFDISDYPYRIDQDESDPDKLCLFSYFQRNDKYVKSAIHYQGELRLLRLSDPSVPFVSIYFDKDNNEYRLPETVRNWGYAIAIARTPEKVLPRLIDTTGVIIPKEERNRRYIESKQHIRNDIEFSKFGDPVWNRINQWFNNAGKLQIPYESLLDLCVVASRWKYLLAFAYQQYVLTTMADMEKLAQQLIKFSSDLAFQWYWMVPYLNADKLNEAIQPFNHNTFSKMIYISHRIKNNKIPDTTILKDVEFSKSQLKNQLKDQSLTREQKKTIKESIENIKKFNQSIEDNNAEFIAWMKDLCKTSLLNTYGATQDRMKDIANDIVNQACHSTTEANVGDLDNVFSNQTDPEIIEFFRRFLSESNRKEFTRNEIWVHERVNAVASHFRGEYDLFEQQEKIRRNIMFCRKSCDTRRVNVFTMLLNNALLKR